MDIITIFVGLLLYFNAGFFIAFKILFYFNLHIKIDVNLIIFYVSNCILSEKVIAFCFSITFHVIIAIYDRTIILSSLEDFDIHIFHKVFLTLSSIYDLFKFNNLKISYSHRCKFCGIMLEMY